MERREEGEKEKSDGKGEGRVGGKKTVGKINVREKAEGEDGFQAVSLGGSSSSTHRVDTQSQSPLPCLLPSACHSVASGSHKIFIILLPALFRLSLPLRCQNGGIIRGKTCLSPGMVADSQKDAPFWGQVQRPT